MRTWWCGDKQSLEYVLEKIDDIIIKPAFASTNEPIFGHELSATRRSEVVAMLQAQPRQFVAQERLTLSTAPVLEKGATQPTPRAMVLRTYLTADRDSFAVMPGGLTRVSRSADSSVVSMQRGGGSKDTWVLATGSVSEFSLLPAPTERVELSRAGGDLPSRVADNLFWLGRYAERAEGTTRLLRAIVSRLVENNGLASAPELPALLRTLTLHCDALPGFVGAGAEARLNRPVPEVLALVNDRRRHGSLESVLEALVQIASVVRDRISTDMWRVLNSRNWFETHHAIRSDDSATLGDVLDALGRTIITLSAFSGMVVENMTRGESWRFLDMGRKIERCLHIIHLLRGTFATAQSEEGPILDAVLEIADASMTYRRRYLGNLRLEGVLDLLVQDETNPRSLATLLAALADEVDHLPRTTPRVGRGPEQRLALTALNRVRMADIEQLIVVRKNARPALSKLLDKLLTYLPELSETITQRYLSHLQTSRHLTSAQ